MIVNKHVLKIIVQSWTKATTNRRIGSLEKLKLYHKEVGQLKKKIGGSGEAVAKE